MARRGKPPGPPKPPKGKPPDLRVVPHGRPEPGANKCETRATGAELEARLDQVETWELDGFSWREIVQLAEETWGVKSRQTDNYIALVHDRYVERHLPERRKARARHVAIIERVGGKAFREGEYAVAVAAQARAARIDGSIFHPELDAGDVPDDRDFEVEWGEQVEGSAAPAGGDDE